MRAPAGAIVAFVALAVLAGCSTEPTPAIVGIQAVGCRAFPERGSGMLVEVTGSDEPLVLTSAHVVAGADRITVTHDEVEVGATVVAFDPDMDLAYLAADGLAASHAWTVDSSAVEGGEHATVYVVRDGEVVAVPSDVGRRIRIRTEDIYVEGETLRPGYELSAQVQPGDSGGAVVVDGQVVGVVWASSRQDDRRAYAIDPHRAGEHIQQQVRTRDLGAVDLTRC